MDTFASQIPFIIGAVFCAIVIAQLSFWTTSMIVSSRAHQNKVTQSRQSFSAELNSLKSSSFNDSHPSDCVSWNGYRHFKVDKLVREADEIMSVYLKPEDNKPLGSFRPGQYLTFQIKLPEKEQPLVRCYSLSDEPNPDYYRCSVKLVPPPQGLPAGKVSSFFNDTLQVNDSVLIKAPAGKFILDTQINHPVVLLGGGIGITPLISMIKALTRQQPDRKAVLFYGLMNSSAHAFKEELSRLKERNSNLQIVTCYSNPLPADIPGKDFDIEGWVTLDLLSKVLPSNDFDFYLCGPPPFMESIYSGLIDWGVPETSIKFESFGPASLRKRVDQSTQQADESSPHKIRFTQTGQTATWNAKQNSLLDLAEAAGIEMESGCRSGSCSTCVTRVIKGEFEYVSDAGHSTQKNECLICIAQPTTDLELDA